MSSSPYARWVIHEFLLEKEHSAEKDELINQIIQLTVDISWLK